MNATRHDEPPKAKAGAKGEQSGGLIARLTRWKHYSVTFGLVMPVACFALEFVLLPILGWLPGLIFFHRFRLFGYGVVAMELIALAVWLRCGPRVGRWSAGFAGVLLAGSLFAGVLGIVLLPFAIPGILAMGIGLLGLVPLFTAHVYYRHGMEAFRQAESTLGKQARIEAMLWGAVLAYLLPGLVQARITLTTRSLLREVIAGDAKQAEVATVRLKRYAWVADFDYLRRAHERETDAERRSRIGESYRRVSGNPIDEGPGRLFEYGGPDRVIPD